MPQMSYHNVGPTMKQIGVQKNTPNTNMLIIKLILVAVAITHITVMTIIRSFPLPNQQQTS